jgi:beta-glucosidase
VNYYFENAAAFDETAPFKYSNKPSWQDTTFMGWPIVPGGLERQLLWIAGVSKGAFGKPEIPIYITENGCACDDKVAGDGRIHDRERIDYLKRHLAVCADLIKRGIPIKGYYHWSLLDNFEWAYGYSKRFGLAYTDFKTQKRILKDSAYFFRDLIAGFAE